MSARETWAAAPVRHKVIWSGFALIVTLVGISAVSPDDPTPPARAMSPIEAACEVLNEGDDPQFAYEVVHDILKDHSLDFPDPDGSARLAVRMAEAEGCG